MSLRWFVSFLVPVYDSPRIPARYLFRGTGACVPTWFLAVSSRMAVAKFLGPAGCPSLRCSPLHAWNCVRMSNVCCIRILGGVPYTDYVCRSFRVVIRLAATCSLALPSDLVDCICSRLLPFDGFHLVFRPDQFSHHLGFVQPLCSFTLTGCLTAMVSWICL